MKRAKTSHLASVHPISSTSGLSEATESSEKVNDFILALLLTNANCRIMAHKFKKTIMPLQI